MRIECVDFEMTLWSWTSTDGFFNLYTVFGLNALLRNGIMVRNNMACHTVTINTMNISTGIVIITLVVVIIVVIRVLDVIIHNLLRLITHFICTRAMISNALITDTIIEDMGYTWVACAVISNTLISFFHRWLRQRLRWRSGADHTDFLSQLRSTIIAVRTLWIHRVHNRNWHY